MRRYLTFALRAVISLALIYLALSGVDLSTISARLREIKIEWMLAAVALAFLQLALLSERWRRIANACDAPLPLPTSFRFNLIGAFFNQVLPSTVGGDAMRIWLLARRGSGFSKATHSVLLDRFVGVLTLALLVAACLPWTLVLVQIGRAHV